MSVPDPPEPLREYREKRDFGRTPEPLPGPRPGREGDPVFVVHRHDATRLHFDLRIERAGVLCSWAIPKGFSYDPADKHLAVRTEDHPLEYEHFAGVIPKGEYGAGTLAIWDRGTFTFLHGRDTVEAGEAKLILRGRRLRGEWHLVRTQQGENTWLLFKSKDRYAGPRRDSVLGVDLAAAPVRGLPHRVMRMRPDGGAAPFDDPGWIHEALFEGRRLLLERDGERVRLRGLRRRVPGLEAEALGLRAERALLDGVLVAADADDRPSRELLEARLSAGELEGLVFYAFDLLHFDDYDLRGLSLLDRKAGLRAILPGGSRLLFVDHVSGHGTRLAETVAAAGLPGLVSKRAASTYRGGASGDWLEVPVDCAPVAPDVRTALERGRVPRGASARVRYTRLDKVYWPADGLTKGDLLGYYEAVADTLLPYLRDRPLHLHRFPDGIEGKSFYQRDAKEETPDWVRTVELGSKGRGEAIRYPVCDDRETLLYLANLGSIDLHPWMSRVGSLDQPDWAVIDLDPKEAPFTDVIQIARRLGTLLAELGLRGQLKTSGKTGLHVFLGLAPGCSYDQATLLTESLARIVARELPGIATVERVVGQREGKVYVDFGQNRRGQTVVPPYVVRPARGGTVSTPLDWDELERDLHPSHFTLLTVPERLGRVGDLFAPVLEAPQELADAVAGLEAYLGR